MTDQPDTTNPTPYPELEPEVHTEVRVEAAQRPDGTVPIELGNGATVHVPMQVNWRKSAQDFMRVGDFDSWAESVLDEDGIAAWEEWMDTDPTLGDISAFFENVGKATGLAAGGNRASRRSSTRTLRR
jgi:hypothetical protein